MLVWLNTNGSGFAASATIQSPGIETLLAHVQLVDINGNGTYADVVCVDGGNYRYIDLLGGRPTVAPPPHVAMQLRQDDRHRT